MSWKGVEINNHIDSYRKVTFGIGKKYDLKAEWYNMSIIYSRYNIWLGLKWAIIIYTRDVAVILVLPVAQ